MFKFFKPSTLDPLSVTMVGIKLADRVLVVGCHDPRLIAALAIKAGLTGRACAVDASADVVREAERIALREGALVEFASSTGTLPYGTGEFDVVVLRDVMRAADAGEQAGLASESSRVLRAGGRCMVINTVGPPGGVAALFGRTPLIDPEIGERIVMSLKNADFVAVRTLAEREGLLFLEAVKRA